MEKYDFVAVDFENADHDQQACQVGIAAVKNNTIVKELSYLIQPPGNRYGKIQTSKHGISAKKTENSPTLDVLWTEIEPYFNDQTLLCHNAPADLTILNKSLTYYFLPMPSFTQVIDTCDAIGKIKLDVLADAYGVKLERHHDALEDAKATAEIWIKHNQGVRVDASSLLKKSESKSNKSFGDKRLDPDLLVKDLTDANPRNPFYDRKIVITGDFLTDRKTIAYHLKKMGADINSTISKKTDFVLVGQNPGPAKMEKIAQLKYDGYEIRLLNESDFEKIYNGEYDSYYVDKGAIKDLKITLEHITGKSKLDIDLNKINIFAMKEIYVADGIQGNRSALYQMFGNLGAAINVDIDATTDVILLSDKSFKNINNNVPDKTIAFIEQTYNSQKAVNFKFKFIIESEFLNYYKHRMDLSKDPVVIKTYEHYWK